MTSDGLQNSKVKLWHKWLQQQLVAELRHFAVELLEKRYSIEVLEKSWQPIPHAPLHLLAQDSSLLHPSSQPALEQFLPGYLVLARRWFFADQQVFFSLVRIQNYILPSAVQKFYRGRYAKRCSHCSSHIAHDKP